MITLNELNKKVTIPEHDYLFEKTEKLPALLEVLTPKFIGIWVIVIVDPKITWLQDMLKNTATPDWIRLMVYMPMKKIEVVCQEHPNMFPKKLSNKELFDEAISRMKHLINPKATKLLYKALGNNFEELSTLLKKLDDECEGIEITLKDVQTVTHYTKITYASDVLNAFLSRDRYRWKCYEQLVRNLGMQYAYYALRSYCNKLMKEKVAYLRNQQPKIYSARTIDAPAICYAYVLFSNSTTYNQLPAIMWAIEHRCAEVFEKFTNNKDWRALC